MIDTLQEVGRILQKPTGWLARDSVMGSRYRPMSGREGVAWSGSLRLFSSSRISTCRKACIPIEAVCSPSISDCRLDADDAVVSASSAGRSRAPAAVCKMLGSSMHPKCTRQKTRRSDHGRIRPKFGPVPFAAILVSRVRGEEREGDEARFVVRPNLSMQPEVTLSETLILPQRQDAGSTSTE